MSLGQEEAFASEVARFLYYMIPFILLDMSFWIISVYFQAQKIVFVQIAIVFIGLFVGLFFLWLFTTK